MASSGFPKIEVSVALASNDEAAALAAFDDFNDETIVDSPDVAAARAALRARPGQALRVAVSRFPDSDGTLRVKPLADDAVVPVGMTEALLVSVDPNVDLLPE